MYSFFDEIEQGNLKSLRKNLSEVKDWNFEKQDFALNKLKRKKKRPPVIGLIGTPGAGKSSFLNAYISYEMKKKKPKKIGLLLIDPSNPKTGGSLLGDRVRLSEHYLNDNLFIRSISGHSNDDGLTPFLDSYLELFLLYPFDLVMVEAVGGGQANTALINYVDHLTLIFDPYTGDGIQHLKSGVLDMADSIIISKKDLYESENVMKSLKDWISEEKTIFQENLRDQARMDQLLEGLTPKFKQNKTKNLLEYFFQKIFLRRLNTLAKSFLTNDISKKNKSTDLNSQEYIKKFSDYLRNNY